MLHAATTLAAPAGGVGGLDHRHDLGEVMGVIQAADAARRSGDGGGGMQYVPVEQGPLEA